MIPEDSIEPLDMPSRSTTSRWPTTRPPRRSGKTAVIKLNGGLGTSMGMDRAKSLLCVRRGLSFLDIIARQVLHLRQQYDATLPLIFMNSFRTSDDTLAALARYDDLAGRGPAAGVPAEQGAQAPAKRPHAGRLARGPRPRVVPARPRRPLHRAARHRPARPAASSAGYRYAFVSNSDNLGAVPDAARRRLVRRLGCAVRDRGGAAHAVGPQGRPLRPPQGRRPHRAARDRADAPTRTARRWPTSTATASPRPTTCGSTWAR